MFERFPSLTRFSHGWTITEKLDGTNAAVYITSMTTVAGPEAYDNLIASFGGMGVWAQSRSKLITPGKSTDNHGFASYVKDHAEQFVELLGEGRHFGEWVGPGVNKRHYNLKEKQFALFNVHRWRDQPLPSRTTVVPTFSLNQYQDNPGEAAKAAMDHLETYGSLFGPQTEAGRGFNNPEGVVMYHGPSQTTFKKTFDYDEQGKWADKHV